MAVVSIKRGLDCMTLPLHHQIQQWIKAITSINRMSFLWNTQCKRNLKRVTVKRVTLKYTEKRSRGSDELWVGHQGTCRIWQKVRGLK